MEAERRGGTHPRGRRKCGRANVLRRRAGSLWLSISRLWRHLVANHSTCGKKNLPVIGGSSPARRGAKYLAFLGQLFVHMRGLVHVSGGDRSPEGGCCSSGASACLLLHNRPSVAQRQKREVKGPERARRRQRPPGFHLRSRRESPLPSGVRGQRAEVSDS